MPVIHRSFASRPALALLLALALSFPFPALAGSPGLIVDNTTHTINAGTTVSGESDAYSAVGVRATNAVVDNQGTVTATSTSTATTTFGWESTGILSTTSTISNSGTITSASDTQNSLGIRLNGGSLNNSGSITASARSGGAQGVDMIGPVGPSFNSGSITATSVSGDTYGLTGSNAITNTGAISASSGSGDSVGVCITGNTFHNSGALSATSASGSAQAILAQSGSSVYLESGTRILSGDVYSNGGHNNLFATADTDMDFDLTGAWDTVTKSGSGTWTLNSGTSATVVDLAVSSGTMYLASGSALTATNLTVSGGSLVIPGSGQTTAPLQVTGTLNGSIAVDVLGSNLGSDSAIVSGTGAAVALTSYNPNFTVQSSFSGGVTSATATYTPQDDGATLGAVASLASAQAFAGVSQARSLTLLAGGANTGGATADSEAILVAANGSLDHILDPRGQEPAWGVYLQPVHTASTRDGSGEGYESRLYGLEAGIDRRFGDWVLGVMIGGGLANINYTGSAFVENDNEDQTFYTAGLYAGYRYGDWDFADTLSLTYADHDSERNAGGGQTATADYDSWLAANQLLAVYHWRPAESWTVSPRAGLNLIHLHRGAFGESGAANAVSYDDLDKFFADASLGVRVEREFAFQGARITPYAGAGLVHALGDTDITVDQHLGAASAQLTTDADTDRATGELGVTLARNNTAFTLGYSGEYGEDTKSHSILGTLRVRF